jgi:hypothetical protein
MVSDAELDGMISSVKLKNTVGAYWNVFFRWKLDNSWEYVKGR